ncbi:ABC transporter permease [Spirosoma sp.]|uniref:ABC transporter permease n=1 Tax=Spirosoma sp. TaxID=1899569 RepID=UPI003B3B231C
MLTNYFKIAWRNLVRKRAFTLLNTLGLSVGVAAALLLFLVVRYELSFDKFHTQYDRIYRVARHEVYSNGSDEFTPGSALPVAAALKADIPQFEKIVPVFGTLDPQVTVLGADAKATNSKTKFIEKNEGLLVEPDFFKLFNFRWILGRPELLERPNVAVLSKTYATKYFSDYQQAIGKFIRINNQTTMQVVGVLEDAPKNTDFPMNLVISYASKRAKPDLFGFGTFDNWNSTSSNDQIFVLMPEKFSVATANSLLDKFSHKHYDARKANHKKTHFLSPLADMHYDDRFSNFKSKTVPRERIQNIATVGILILLMACINFINIYSALATRRAKEVGVRKVLGSQKSQLVVQFLTETFLVVLTSMVLGVTLAYLALPLLEKVFDVPANLSTYLDSGLGLMLLGLLLALTLLSGLYPSLILSSFSPLEVFRKNLSKGWMQGVSLRQGLIVFQFATALVLIISTVINLRQMSYLSKLDLGFTKEGVLTLNMDTEYRSRYATFRNELMQLPDVKAVSFSSDHPSSDNNWQSNFSFTNLSKDEDFQLSMKMADGGYFATYDLKFLAGAPYAINDTLTKFVVNETLLKKLGIKNPESVLGRKLRMGGLEPAPIVGVVKDFHTSSAREAINPMLMMISDKYYWSGGVKIQSKNLPQTVDRIKAAYEKIFPEVAFDGQFYDESLNNYYKAEHQMGMLSRVFAGLAIFIACLGLFGLAAFTAESRTKEIGVRKVLGASVFSIISLLSKDFLKLVVVAIVLASPIAWYLMRSWLEDFQYRIAIEWWVFALAGTLAIAIALLTVSFQSIKAALTTPVKSLRSE